MSSEKYKIGFVGAGKLAANLMAALSNSACQITEIVSLEDDNGRELAGLYGAAYSTTTGSIDGNIDLLVIAVPDSVIPAVVTELTQFPGTVVHTSGSVSIDVFSNLSSGYGVLYPLQTFSESRIVDFSTIPIFIEASDMRSLLLIRDISGLITKNIYEINSEKRALLHLSAVFASNFTNHLLAVSTEILSRAGIEREVLNSLVRETMEKSFEMEPIDSQTGPAVRGDGSTIKKHLNLLSFSSELSQLYTFLTKSIQKLHSVKTMDD